MTKPPNPHIGSTLEDFLAEEGILEEAKATATQRVLSLLLEHGDALTTVREIDHFSYFPTSEGRARFVEKCLVAGLKLRALSEPDEVIDRFGVILFCDDIPDEDVLLKMHEMLTMMAEAEGGNYDGWETQVIA